LLRHHESYYSSAYRSARGISDQGISVIVQSMVYGNLTTLSSGVGSAFSRCRESGKPVCDGVYHSRAEGGDEVVPGSRELSLFKELQVLQPKIYSELTSSMASLEADFRDLVRADFVVENGELYIVHACPVLGTPRACFRMLNDFTSASYGLLSQREAVCRVSQGLMTRSAANRPPATAALLQLPDGNSRVWEQDSHAHRLLHWAKDARSSPAAMKVMTLSATVADVARGAALSADTYGALCFAEMTHIYFADEIAAVGSPVKTAGERSLCLHDLRQKLAEQVIQCIETATNARPMLRRPTDDDDDDEIGGNKENEEGMEVASAAAVAMDIDHQELPQQQQQQGGGNYNPQQSRPIRSRRRAYSTPEDRQGAARAATAARPLVSANIDGTDIEPLPLLASPLAATVSPSQPPSLTVLLCGEQMLPDCTSSSATARDHTQQKPGFLSPDFLQCQAQAAAQAVLDAGETMYASHTVRILCSMFLLLPFLVCL
jgi:hypothetical protein